MPLLPAQIPDIPESRAHVVPARLARKVAPLFGVPWVEGPFGERTWVSEYASITLSEIARGAPLPRRSRVTTLPAGTDAELPWRLVDRFVVTSGSASLPNEIANATLNRFGPDTKAAVVLTAANRLFEPVTSAICSVLPLLVDHDGAPLPADLMLAAWAGLVIEVFRSQPALVAAAIRARAIQRELAVTWTLPLAPDVADLQLARCEIGARLGEQTGAAPDRPRELQLIDATFERLIELAEPPDGTGASEDLDVVVTRRLAQDETVGHLLRRILEMGTLHDASYLWLGERRPGQLVVEALVSPTNLIHVFVQEVMRTTLAPVLPRIPDRCELAALSVLARRAMVLALLTALRQIQFRPAERERTRDEVIELLNRLASTTRDVLDDDDPVRAIALCRIADMIVHTVRHDAGHDLREPLEDLVAAMARCEDLHRAGLLDSGAAAEAVSSACVEINVVRWTNAADPAAGLPLPEELDAVVRRGWQSFHRALGLADTGRPAAESDLAGYHLHNYAAFLASHRDRPDDLLAAVELFRDVVLPARIAFYGRTGSFLPLRNSLQTASRATSALGESAHDRGDRSAAIEWAELGHGWINRVLAHPDTARALGEPTERTVRLALLATPALLLAVEVEAPGASPADLDTAETLITLVEGWERHAVPEDPVRHVRHGEVVELRRRLGALRSAP